jgi:DNA (cytosine-5)-methyltransferase 1
LADLPYIGDGKHDVCIPFPDHRQCYGVTKKVRTQFSLIPTRPYQTNFVKAYYSTGVITEAERQMAFPAAGMRVERVSQAWGRVHPKKIMATVTTAAHPADTFMGKCLHWSQPRILSIMEVRRAQGFRDHEVILGETKEQWTTIGNSVAREVSIALGLSFREALLGSLVKSEETLHADASPIAEKMSVLATPGTTTPIQTPPMIESPAPRAALSDVLRREALFNSVRVPLDDDASDTTRALRSLGPDGTEEGIDDFAAAKDYPPRYASSSRSSSDELTSNRFSVSTQATAVTRITSQETIHQGKKRQSSSMSEAFEIHTTETTTIGEMEGVKRQRLEGV